jgi:hypothetical protein
MTEKIDPATLQTAAGMPSIKSMNESLLFSGNEVKRLKELSKRVAEIAHLPVQQKKAKLWTQHNDLKTQEPLIFIDPENGWNECVPANTLSCIVPMARVWEMFLLKQIYWFEVLKDDKVIEPFFDIPLSFSDTGWGVELAVKGGAHGGAYKHIQAIEDYETDLPKISYPKIIIDKEESKAVLDLAHKIFDGTLEVRQKTIWWWTLGLTWDYVRLRGLEDFMCDMITYPEDVHKLMGLICDGVMDRLDFLQENGYLSSNTGGTYVGSGGFGYTDDLPLPDEKPIVGTMDMWGFVESQESVAIAPQMYNEFIFPYHKKIAERFGINCYGCCENYSTRWEYVKNIPRLRRVSVSPWEDVSKLPEYLGKNYISSVKPNPSYLAWSNMDEDIVRKELKNVMEQTKDCVVEVIMKDNNTLGKNPANASRWVEIAREEAAAK